MKRNNKKTIKYPRLSVRISPDLLQELNSVRTTQNLSHGQIVVTALRIYLPKLKQAQKPLDALAA